MTIRLRPRHSPNPKKRFRPTFIFAIAVLPVFAIIPSEAFGLTSVAGSGHLESTISEADMLPTGVSPGCTTEQLMWAVEHAEFTYQRRYAALLLGDRKAKEAFPNLLNALRDPEEEVQTGAAEALAEIGDQSILPDLISNTKNPTPSVRQYSAYVIGRLAHKDKETIRANQDVVEGLEKLAEDKESAVRVEAVYALYEVGSKTSEEIFIRGLYDVEPRIRSYAATALGDLRTRDATQALIDALEKETDVDVRRKMAAALGGIGGSYALDTLVRMLPKETPPVRTDIALKLGEVKSQQAVDILCDLLQNDPDGRVRSAAASALKQANNSAAVPALAKALTDRVASVRRPASEALVDLADESVLDDLVGALGYSDREVANNAARALIRINSFDAVHGLIKALDSPSKLEVDLAIKVLEEITYRPYGSNTEKWKTWYVENYRPPEPSP